VLKEKLDLETHTTEGWTALQAASSFGFAGIVGMLLDAGANPEERTSGGYTSLHAAAVNGRDAAIDVLVDHGANINARFGPYDTPRSLAASSGYRFTANNLAALGGGGMVDPLGELFGSIFKSFKRPPPAGEEDSTDKEGTKAP
jgi:ankyrin repeat protein